MLCWIDIETTGLDPLRDGAAVLEFGYALTTDDLDVVSRRAWLVESPVRPVMDMEADAMHRKSGLLAEWESSTTYPWPWIAKLFTDDVHTWCPEPPRMAGSSIHFDRMWLHVHAPAVLVPLHYRSVDVSSLRDVMALWGGVDIPRPTPGIHRVVEDLDDTLWLARECRNVLVTALR